MGKLSCKKKGRLFQVTFIARIPSILEGQLQFLDKLRREGIIKRRVRKYKTQEIKFVVLNGERVDVYQIFFYNLE